MTSRPAVTFDLFSALLDSRHGGSATFDRMAIERGWGVAGEDVYDHWDRLNKAGQGGQATASGRWLTYRDIAQAALAETYADLALAGEPDGDADVVIDEMADWPLWPAVADELPALSGYRVGLLSNVDDDIVANTAAAALIDPELWLTSQRLGAYKPSERIYTEARRVIGPLVHVATSARDVRGALEAGLPVVRLRRPGHELDPAGPRPPLVADAIAELPGLVAEAARNSTSG